MYQLVDYVTRQVVEPQDFVFTGEDHPWEVVMDLKEVKQSLNLDYFRRAPALVSKYLPFLPVDKFDQFVSLSEGGTPLIRDRKLSHQLGIKLYFKLEGQNPTGSFKDRGSAVEITMAKQLNAPAIVLASTGNMAASCACYAAAANLPCFVFVPEATPESKLAQVISYGGKIVQVKGNYNQAADLAVAAAKQLGFYLSGDYAFRTEGQKTAAFEIADQMFYQVPDVLIVPMGVGTNLAAYYKGFQEYFQLKLIDRLPRIYGVEAKGANAIVQAFRQHSQIKPLAQVSTIASAIAVSYPYDGIKALDAIQQTHGQAIDVDDQQILESQYQLAHQTGIFAESSSAASFAALRQLVEQGEVKSGESVVCVLTGNGLKDPSTILKAALKPPTIKPVIDDFINLYQQQFFEGKNVVFFDQTSILFAKLPGLSGIKKAAWQYFGVELEASYLQLIQNKIKQFLQKGKQISFTDFQDILEETLETAIASDSNFEVLDFSVHTSQDQPAQAEVKVKANSQQFTAQAEGTGPVDAVINALRKAVGRQMNFQLTDYAVEIRGKGTDAVVSVSMALKQDSQTSWGTGVSPDIIQASIEAFVDAYNGFDLQQTK